MSERKLTQIIGDILRAIEHIEIFTEGLSYVDFAKNFMISEACMYNIQVIGEAVSQLPDQIKDAETSIPWHLIKGMRNRLIHAYFGTDLEVVWNVVAEELPTLKIEFLRMQLELSNNNL